MDFLIADTFTQSLAKLSGDEQKVVKTTAFDLQLNPGAPGHQFHQLERARDKRFWSVRASDDLRLIVHRGESSLLLCYVDHHNAAYAWAERRRLEVHPKTGAAQLVEIRERVQEIVIPTFVQTELPAPPKPGLFAQRSDDELLRYGVPAEWLDTVRQADEDSLLRLTDHLPAEAAEALLELAVGGTPKAPEPAAPEAGPFEHPDAQRRFRMVANVDELAMALAAPWEQWTVFLHPAQRATVERTYRGPARVSGSAGTGKTVVALHRAVHLARSNPDARVLLTTFSDPLAHALTVKLRHLLAGEPRLAERLEVHALDAIALRLYGRLHAPPRLASPADVQQLLATTAEAEGEQRFSQRFLASEWTEVVDAWGLTTWEAYRDVARLGRRTRLPEAQRASLWRIFEHVLAGLSERGLLTQAQVYGQLTADFKSAVPPFEHVVVDEAQDVSVPQLRFLAALAGSRPNGLFFAGDLGQRIFQQPFSWKALGVDVRGRARTLRVNYRTSHQIRARADQLLGPQVADVDGNVEERRGTVSVFNGPEPTVHVAKSSADEQAAIAAWLRDRLAAGLSPHEIGVFVRSEAELPRAEAVVVAAGLPYRVLDSRLESPAGHAALGTMHLAKGLEFRAVVVAACDDEVIPLQARIESVTDDAELAEVYNTERHLLYVACTRARDELLVTATAPASEFLDDLQGLSGQHASQTIRA